MLESCKRYITSRMLCYVNRTFNRVHSVPSCESCVVWVLGFVFLLYPITRESDPAPRKTAASVAPSGAGSHSNFNLVALRCPLPRFTGFIGAADNWEHRTLGRPPAGRERESLRKPRSRRAASVTTRVNDVHEACLAAAARRGRPRSRGSSTAR